MEDKKLQCPNCSQPMKINRIETNVEQPRIHYECKPCGVGITETIGDNGPGDRTLQ